MPKCTFCGESIKKGTGKIFVYASGKIVHFCTNKCEKNLLKLKRKPLQTKWTEAYRNEKHKSGTGKKLLLKMEEIAKIRGCLYVKVDIYDFQAKSFYEKNGYKVIFSLSDYPFSGEKHYLTKN